MNTMEYGQLDGVALPITPFCGCGKCVIAVRRLSRKTDATSSPDRQARQVIRSVDDIGGHIIGWADDWEVSGAVNPLERPALGPWLRDERGPYAGIVGADVSRIGRDVRDILNTGWMMKDTGRLLITADHGVWDLTDPAQENQFMAQAWGAQMELRAIQKRNSDAAINSRAAGSPRGLNSYGYRFVRLIPTGKVDHVELDPEAAATIREVAQRILDDESGMITVATEAVRLNRAGVLAPRDHRGVAYGREPKGYLWSDKALKLILTSQAALGYLIHEGKPVLRQDGHPVRLADPLWDHATHKALVEKLTAKRPTGTRAPRGLRLLAGRAFCGTCQRRLHVSTLVLRNGEKELRYICNGRTRGVPMSADCKPAPTMLATDMERIVTDKFLAEWGDTPLLRREFDPGTGYAARIAELERDQERLERDRAAGLFERPDAEARYYENHKRMTAEITELSVLPDRPASMVLVPTGKTVADQWHAAKDDSERRDILASYRIKALLFPHDGHAERVLVHNLDPEMEADAREALLVARAEQREDAEAYEAWQAQELTMGYESESA